MLASDSQIELLRRIEAVHEEYLASTRTARLQLAILEEKYDYVRRVSNGEDPRIFMRPRDLHWHRGLAERVGSFEKRVISCANNCLRFFLDNFGRVIWKYKPEYRDEEKALNKHFSVMIGGPYTLDLMWVLFKQNINGKIYSEVFLARIHGLKKDSIIPFPVVPIRACLSKGGEILEDLALRYFNASMQREMQRNVIIFCNKLKEKFEGN